jgi:Fe-S-cluster-containing hydrogenase component 2
MKESTKNIFKMHGWRIDRAIHNYIYFAYYQPYIKYFLKTGRMVTSASGLKLTASAFQMVFNRYHAKVITPGDSAKIFSLNRSVALGPDTSERIIPFPYANQIILNEPDYIAVMDCPCRSAREKHCEPVNVCLAVGRTTAQFWVEHGQKYHARKITQQEALDIIRAGRERGNITTSWFKVATGGRTGVICNCCRCCCGGLEATRIARSLKHGEDLSIMIPSGYGVDHDPKKCKLCGNCEKICFFGAIKKQDDIMTFDHELCMGCGLCVEKCRNSARVLTSDFKDLLPLDLDLAKAKLGKSRDHQPVRN